jgi:hypothetical protein
MAYVAVQRTIRIAIVLFWLSCAVNLVWMARDLSWWVIPAALFGWYCADMASGIVHMYMDYRPCKPGVGLDTLFFYEDSRAADEYVQLRNATLARVNALERLIFDFKNHHPRPDALGRRSMIVQIGTTILYGSLPFSVLLNLACLLLAIPGWLVAGAVSFLIGGTFAQYFHGSLHRADNPSPVLLMRKLRLLMRPQDHERHHATLTCDFSTNNGWSNPLLNMVFNILRKQGYMPDEGLVPR